jgi:hypothetical protein
VSVRGGEPSAIRSTHPSQLVSAVRRADQEPSCCPYPAAQANSVHHRGAHVADDAGPGTPEMGLWAARDRRSVRDRGDFRAWAVVLDRDRVVDRARPKCWRSPLHTAIERCHRSRVPCCTPPTVPARRANAATYSTIRRGAQRPRTRHATTRRSWGFASCGFVRHGSAQSTGTGTGLLHRFIRTAIEWTPLPP